MLSLYETQAILKDPVNLSKPTPPYHAPHLPSTHLQLLQLLIRLREDGPYRRIVGRRDTARPHYDQHHAGHDDAAQHNQKVLRTHLVYSIHRTSDTLIYSLINFTPPSRHSEETEELVAKNKSTFSLTYYAVRDAAAALANHSIVFPVATLSVFVQFQRRHRHLHLLLLLSMLLLLNDNYCSTSFIQQHNLYFYRFCSVLPATALDDVLRVDVFHLSGSSSSTWDGMRDGGGRGDR